MRIMYAGIRQEGGYKAGSAVLNDKGSFGLAPGESKLLFAVAPRTSVILTGQTDKGEEYRSEKFRSHRQSDGVQRFWKNMAREKNCIPIKG